MQVTNFRLKAVLRTSCILAVGGIFIVAVTNIKVYWLENVVSANIQRSQGIKSGDYDDRENEPTMETRGQTRGQFQRQRFQVD